MCSCLKLLNYPLIERLEKETAQIQVQLQHWQYHLSQQWEKRPRLFQLTQSSHQLHQEVFPPRLLPANGEEKKEIQYLSSAKMNRVISEGTAYGNPEENNNTKKEPKDSSLSLMQGSQ